MEILLAFIFGAAIGTAAHAVMPDRETRGVVLAPMVGALSGGAAWMVLTWLGFAVDNPLLWVVSIVVPVAVTLPVIAVLARVRVAHDRRERIRLRIT